MRRKSVGLLSTLSERPEADEGDKAEPAVRSDHQAAFKHVAKGVVPLKGASQDLRPLEEAVAQQDYATVLEDDNVKSQPEQAGGGDKAGDKRSAAHDRKLSERRHSVAAPTMAFSVTKVNQRGRRQQRVLRLSLVGIENVRGEVSSSIFEYSSVKKIVLNSVVQFSIYYVSGKHPYVYLSPVTIQIVAEITRRVNEARHRLSAARLQYGADDYQDTLRLSLADLVTRTRSERVRQLAQATAATAVAAAAVAGLSAQERVVMVVWSALNSAKSDERRALYRFVNEQKAASVTAEGQQVLAHNVRTFLDGLRFHFLQTRQKEFAAAAGADCADPENLIRHAVEVTLESAVVPLLLVPIVNRYTALNAAKDESFRAASDRLSLCTQEQLHVPKAFCTANGYVRSAAILGELEKELMPSEVLDVILKTVHTVYSEASECAAGVMAGDDFLPVLIHVIVKARLLHPFARAQYSLELSDPDELQGEAGYFLTVFESALIWIVEQKEL